MGRRRRLYLDRVNGMLLTWADYTLRLKDSGYPHSTVEARLMEGTGASKIKPGPRIPYQAWMPEHVARVDRAVRVMPSDLAVIVTRHWLEGQKVSRHCITEVLQWLAGHMR